MKKTLHIVSFLLLTFMLNACRETPVVPVDDSLHFGHGLYILNEGNMGSNKATIDFYDTERDTFYRDIYPIVNPTVIKELGDVGNDLQIYGGKMYAVINVSGKIEVMDTQCRRITQIDVPNCRSLAFSDGFAYVTSYAGPIDYANPQYEQKGFVAKIDTATLSIVDTCIVGFQPNGIATDGTYLYVANSGGYMAPNYDSTLSVIQLDNFQEIKKITIAKNLDAVVFDPIHQAIFVSSLGDYYTTPAQLYRVDAKSHEIKPLGFSASRLFLTEDKLYFYSSDYFASDASYGFLNTSTLLTTKFTPSNASAIRVPYSIFVAEGDIYITDARDYVTPGVLYRYDSEGNLLSSCRTGDIPGHLCLKD